MLRLKSRHRIMCGDSTSEADVSKLMAGEKADMVFTDPPYGIDYDDRAKVSDKFSKGMKPSNKGKILGDDRTDFFEKIYDDKIKSQFWWGCNYYCQDLPKKGSFVVWSKKTEAQRGNKMLFNSDFELCWSHEKKAIRLFEIPWTGCINKEKGESRLHPTQKPIALILRFFDEWGKDKKIVLDYFLGSGSTLIACEKTGRRCFGMELDVKYMNVILKRWEEYTGKTAERIS